MSEPTFFPIWFQAAGFVYIWPQHLAMKLAAAAGVDRLGDAVRILPQRIDEARYLANETLLKVHAARRHYVFLDTDSVATSFDRATQSDPKTIVVLRGAAPEPGSQIQVTYPAIVSD